MADVVRSIGKAYFLKNKRLCSCYLSISFVIVSCPENAANKNPDTAFETHLNKYPTIYIDVTDFTSSYHDNENIVRILIKKVKRDVVAAYPDISFDLDDGLMDTLLTVTECTGEQFVLIIDEWDALLPIKQYGTQSPLNNSPSCVPSICASLTIIGRRRHRSRPSATTSTWTSTG